jgi:hypothetical protein
VPKDQAHVGTEMFDTVEDFFSLPYNVKRRYAKSYAKGERRGYWRQLAREIFEVFIFLKFFLILLIDEIYWKISNGYKMA